MFAVRGYNNLPWCVIPTQVAPVVDILSQDENFLVIFEPPKPIVFTDEVALFKSIASDLQLLRSKRLAIVKMGSTVFCGGSGEQICKLSPKCNVISDPDGTLIRANMRDIPSLGYFKDPRIIAAFRDTKGVENLLKHPATWGPLEDTFLPLHFMMLAADAKVKLDHMIKTSRNGRKNWVLDPAIAADIRGSGYDSSLGGISLDMPGTKSRTLMSAMILLKSFSMTPLVGSLGTLMRMSSRAT